MSYGFTIYRSNGVVDVSSEHRLMRWISLHQYGNFTGTIDIVVADMVDDGTWFVSSNVSVSVAIFSGFFRLTADGQTTWNGGYVNVFRA